MKKLFLVVALAAITFGASAQQKGDFTLGGTLSLSSVTDGDTDFSIAPSAEYFLTDKASVGLSLAYIKMDSESIDAFGFGVSYNRYYKLAEKFYYTPNVYVALAFPTDMDTSFAAGITLVGFEFRPSNHIGLNFSCGGFQYAGSSGYHNIGFSINSTPQLGFKYYF